MILHCRPTSRLFLIADSLTAYHLHDTEDEMSSIQDSPTTSQSLQAPTVGTGTAKRRLLIAYAHPDDESFGLGGLIAKYVAEGVDVYLVCATDGDVGTVSPEFMEGYATIRELRLAELAAATEILGFRHVFTFGYKDSGMLGSAENDDERSLWYAWNHCPEEVTQRMVEVIREVKPQVVITFNKYGGYGHPDHIAIQRATTEAFALANDASYDTKQKPYQPQKLYYSNIPKVPLQLAIAKMRMQGQDPRRLGVNKDIDMVKVLENVEPNHARVNISQYYDIWDRANACHASQGGGGGGFRVVPKSLRRWLAGSQSFTRVYPTPSRNRVDERDLFLNVREE
jgi:LmbE family N-acetylglucosaminyl deacetylase